LGGIGPRIRLPGVLARGCSIDRIADRSRILLDVEPVAASQE
jgi:hypothetical protein